MAKSITVVGTHFVTLNRSFHLNEMNDIQINFLRYIYKIGKIYKQIIAPSNSSKKASTLLVCSVFQFIVRNYMQNYQYS